jgi:nucleotide-binding universal stress UspA family protein
MQILAATDFSTRSNRALRQAGLLAQSCSAQLTVLHVVDDDQPAALVEMESREAERILAEQIAAMPELQGVQVRPMLTPGDPFDGVLKTAAAIGASLIVMGSHRKQLLRDIFIGTTVERVIRTGPFPVLMVQHEAQRRYEKILAPVDMSDQSASALRVGQTAGLITATSTTLLHAFLPVAKGKLFIADAGHATIDSYVASERQAAMDKLGAFLSANGLDGLGLPVHVEEGAAFDVISRAVEEMRPDLLIMGTHGRSGFLKSLLGSVTEEALRSLNVDILVVPPARR